jgi:DNA-binding CsgD family transcriptional regulator
MVSLDAFSKLLEVLYSAPLQDEQWELFLVLLSRHTQSALSVFLAADSRLGVSCRAQGGSGPDHRVDALAYNERYVQNDPFRKPCLQDPRPRIVQGDELLPGGKLLHTELYRDLLAPHDFRYATLILLTLTLRRIEIITIWRTIDQGAMDKGRNSLLHLLFPHIRKALEIRQVLGVAQQRQAGAEAMADASSTATFLVDRQGHVIHSNATADSLIADGSALTIQKGVLTPADQESRKALRRIFLTTTPPTFTPSDAGLTHAILLPRTGSRQPLQLLATPLPANQSVRSGADVLVLVTDPERTIRFPDDVLRGLYGLTPAEVEVANGLMMGYSLNEIACLRRVSEGTVRNQFKAIMSKTATNRQSELVRLLMALPQPFSN